MFAEPNTWRELLAAIEGRAGKAHRGAGVRRNRTTNCWMPCGPGRGSDAGSGVPMGAAGGHGPLRRSRRTHCRNAARMTWPVHHVDSGASTCFNSAESGVAGRPCNRMVIASIGPTTTRGARRAWRSAGSRADASEDGLPGERNGRTGSGDLGGKEGGACLKTIRCVKWASISGWHFYCPVSAFVGYVIGYLLDKVFHTKFLTFTFLLFGIAAGFIELVRELNQDNGAKCEASPYDRIVPGASHGRWWS